MRLLSTLRRKAEALLEKKRSKDIGTLSEKYLQRLVHEKNSATNLFSLLENLLEWSMMQRGLIAFTPVSYLLRPKIAESTTLVLDAVILKPARNRK